MRILVVGEQQTDESWILRPFERTLCTSNPRTFDTVDIFVEIYEHGRHSTFATIPRSACNRDGASGNVETIQLHIDAQGELHWDVDNDPMATAQCDDGELEACYERYVYK